MKNKFIDMYKNFTLLINFFFLSVATSVIGSLFSETKTITNYLAWPLFFISSKFKPLENTPDFFKLSYAILCLYIYIAIIFIPFIYLKKIKLEKSTKNTLEYKLYSEELSAVLDVLEDTTHSIASKEMRLEDFLRSISNNIIESLPNAKVSTLRYSFLLSEPTDANNEYSSVKFGKNGILSENDHKIIEWVLTNKETDFFVNRDVKKLVPNFPSDYDMNSIIIIRNSGSKFRFGFVILSPDENLTVDHEDFNQFVASSSAVRIFAYMDTLFKFMIQYSHKVT